MPTHARTGDHVAETIPGKVDSNLTPDVDTYLSGFEKAVARGDTDSSRAMSMLEVMQAVMDGRLTEHDIARVLTEHGYLLSPL